MFMVESLLGVVKSSIVLVAGGGRRIQKHGFSWTLTDNPKPGKHCPGRMKRICVFSWNYAQNVLEVCWLQREVIAELFGVGVAVVLTVSAEVVAGGLVCFAGHGSIMA